MFMTRKSVAIVGAVLCIASLIVCMRHFAPLRCGFLYVLMYIFLYCDFVWFVHDFYPESEMIRKKDKDGKFMSDTAYAVKSIVVLLMFLCAINGQFLSVRFYEFHIFFDILFRAGLLFIGHVIIFLTQFAYEIGGVKYFSPIEPK